MPAHKIYTYKTPSGIYVYSVRAWNDLKNSLDSGKYASRGGRNWKVRKLLATIYKGAKVIQGRPVTN